MHVCWVGAAGIGFTQKLKRKANEDEIPRRKKQLSVVFRSAARAVEVEPQVLEGADRGWGGLAIAGAGRICTDPAAGL